MKAKYKNVEDCITTRSGLSPAEILYPTRNPYIKNMENAATLIKNLAKEGKSFAVIGDYDTDGVCSSSIMYKILLYLKNEYGTNNLLKIRIPHRITEGYGINKVILKELENFDVIITVDNGIAAIDVISEAKKLGKTVIVIDHHEPVVTDGLIFLPKADVIVDPKAIDGSSYKEYCGAGLCYKLARLIVKDLSLLNEIISLAAIATIGDMVSVLGDNRNIIFDGINNINKGIMPIGLKVLMSELNISTVDEYTFGYVFSPLINAMGRMHDTLSVEGVKLFCSTNMDKCLKISKELISTNEQRKKICAEAMVKIKEVIENDCLYNEVPIIIRIDGLNEGILGILAGRVKEQYNVPAIVFTDTVLDGKKAYKGSARSVDDINIKNLLDSSKKHIFKHGGHKGAAGLTVFDAEFDDFVNIIQKNAENLVISETTNNCDVEIEQEEIAETIEKLKMYSPFGMNNPVLKVLVKNFTLTPNYGSLYTSLGENSSTIKLFGRYSTAIGFNMTDKYLKLEKPVKLNLLGELSENHYMGKTTYQIVIDEMEPCDSNKQESSLQQALRARMALL